RPGDPPPLPGQPVYAVLVSVEGRTSNTGARVVEIDAAGRFEFRFVPPGRYFVLATTAGEEGLWQNMEIVKFLSSSAASLDVTKRATLQIEAPLLSDTDVRRALQQVPR